MMSDANIWSSSCLYHHEDHQEDDHQVKVLINHCTGGPGLVWSVSARPSSLHTVSWSLVTDTSSHCCCCCTRTFHFLFVSEINDKQRSRNQKYVEITEIISKWTGSSAGSDFFYVCWKHQTQKFHTFVIGNALKRILLVIT